MRKGFWTLLSALLTIASGVNAITSAHAAGGPPQPRQNSPAWIIHPDSRSAKPRAAAAPEVKAFANPQPVTIHGYDGDAMEPFLSRDGKYLFFNNRNDPSSKTDLYGAERVDNLNFQYLGLVGGVNTPDKLEGVASLSQAGELFFISDRSYATSRTTIYRGRFVNGKVTGIELVNGVSPKEAGIMVFDAEINYDGKFLYAAYGDLSAPPIPKTADLFVASRSGKNFVRLPDNAKIMANINTPELEYAPATTPSGLHIYFTRMNRATHATTIEHAWRQSARDPFTASETITAITGFAEAPSIASDNNTLYYHTKVGDAYRIFAVSRTK